MKYLKLMLFAVIMAFTFVNADAQVTVRLGGGRYYHGGRHWHHRAPYGHGRHRHYRYY